MSGVQPPDGAQALTQQQTGLPPGHPPLPRGRWRVAGWTACAAVALTIHGTVAAAVLSRAEPPLAGESLEPMPVEIATVAFEDPTATESADAAEAKGETAEEAITETPVADPAPEAVAEKTTTVDAPPEPEAKQTEAPPPEPEQRADAPPPEPEPPKPEVRPEPPAVDPAAKESPAAEVAASPAPAVTAEPVPVAPPPKPLARVKTKLKEKVRAIARAVKAERTQVARASAASQAATGEAEAAARTASAAASRDFGARVRAAIERRKRFPPGVGATGVAAVRFTMTGSGEVVSAALVQSAGNPDLDDAALSAVKTARLPPIPEEIGKSRLTITVPIRFRR
ncbi:TonB family protein [Pseudoxanthobacter sp.]|uniref:TonB family protein n=1 Tax=Pseudoxanthobacter sp. TaxID=1925742 RepID=UPI002FDF827B